MRVSCNLQCWACLRSLAQIEVRCHPVALMTMCCVLRLFFVLFGVHVSGGLRSLEYTPYTPGTGPGGFRWALWENGIAAQALEQ